MMCGATQCNGRMELRASQLGQHSMRLYYLSILYGPMGELYHLGVGARLHQPPCYVICYIMLCAPCPKPSVARSCARWRTWFRFGFGLGLGLGLGSGVGLGLELGVGVGVGLERGGGRRASRRWRRRS